MRSGAGFSLVEVTLALGILAFAFVGVFGLLPAGMNVFRQAMNTTIGGQIAQRVINDALQTDFNQLVIDGQGTPITSAGGTKAVRYFDSQGGEIIPANPDALTAGEKQQTLYWVNTRIVPTTSAPSTGTAQSNGNIATVTVQVVGNPSGQSLDRNTSSKLWTGAYAASPTRLNLVPLTRSVFVARNISP